MSKYGFEKGRMVIVGDHVATAEAIAEIYDIIIDVDKRINNIERDLRNHTHSNIVHLAEPVYGDSYNELKSIKNRLCNIEDMMKYRKKPVVIEAIQWNGNTNKREIDDFVGKELIAVIESETAYIAGMGKPTFSLLIDTKEGIMKAYPNDWIIKEPFPTDDRKFYPCKPDIFEATYESVEEK